MRTCAEKTIREKGLCKKDESGLEDVESEFFMFCN